MDNHHSHKLNLNYRLVSPWLGVAGLVGVGFLPCPECGAPLLWHFWPIAAVLTLRNIVREKKKKLTFSEEENPVSPTLDA